jgi:SSS family transporter
LLVFVLGLSFSRSSGNVKSFFAAGGAVPWWINGLSLFMSFFSVGTFVVWGSIAYNSGLVAVTIQSTMCLAGFVIGCYIAPKWNETRALTAAEFISDRLGAGTQKFYTIIFLVCALFGTGAFLYPVGKMVEVTTGIPLTTGIIAFGVLIVIYTAVGGLWAVLVTDVLQFVVLSAAVLIVVPLAFNQVGGVSGFVSKVPEGFFDLQNAEYTGWFLAAFGIYHMALIGGNWAYVQRYTSVANPQDAKKVGWLFGALYLVAPLVWMLPPMIYRVMEPGLSASESEGAYLMVSQAVVPDGLMGLILGAMVFATASSVNTTLNISAGVFTNDIYKSLRGGASDKETMLVARLSTFAFGVLAVCVALMVTTMGGIVSVVLSMAALTGAAIFLPPIWSLFSKAQTGKTVMIATVSTLSINFAFKFFIPLLNGFSLSRSQEMVLGIIVPVLILAAFDLRFKLQNKSNHQYDQYLKIWKKKHSDQSVLEDKGSEEANAYGRKMIGLGVFCIGLLISVLGMLAGEAQLLIQVTGWVIVLGSLAVIPRSWFADKKEGG